MGINKIDCNECIHRGICKLEDELTSTYEDIVANMATFDNKYIDINVTCKKKRVNDPFNIKEPNFRSFESNIQIPSGPRIPINKDLISYHPCDEKSLFQDFIENKDKYQQQFIGGYPCDTKGCSYPTRTSCSGCPEAIEYEKKKKIFDEATKTISEYKESINKPFTPDDLKKLIDQFNVGVEIGPDGEPRIKEKKND